MKPLLLLTALLLLAGTAIAEEGSIADRIFSPDDLTLGLFSSGMKDSGKPNFSSSLASVDGGNLNPGRAMLMSAIIPGAGEFYAGSKLKAAAFFTVEVLAWTGVILYYNKGKDKEDEFMDFADFNFDENDYRTVEFSLAQSPTWGDSLAYTGGTIDDWTELDWETKIHYLPREGFTHELPTQTDRDNSWSDDQQYYEMIGKYIHQFGFGWDDGFGDDPGTPYFDGRSPHSEFYMDMRHDSNQLLKRSAWGYNIALLNHVASALDASFTVRLKNRTAKAELGFRQVPYDNELVPTGGVNIRW